MTGTPPSRVYLIKAADGFPMGISALGGEEKPVVLILHSPKCVATACPFRPTEAPLTRSKPHNVGRARLSCSMNHASSSCFDTAIPYVFSMCSAPGDGWNPPVIAMATFRLLSFLREERCPMESSFTSGVTWTETHATTVTRAPKRPTPTSSAPIIQQPRLSRHPYK